MKWSVDEVRVASHARCFGHGRMGRVRTTEHAYATGATGAPYRRSLADDLLATDVTRVTVQKLLGHAHV